MTPSKNILIVVTQGIVGGPAQSLSLLARGLAARGHTVTIGWGGSGTFLEEKLAGTGIRCVRFKYLSRNYNPFLGFLFTLELRQFVQRNKFDVVHLNCANTLFGTPGVWSVRKRPRMLYTVRGLMLADPNHRGNKLFMRLVILVYKTCFAFTDQIVFLTQRNLADAKRVGLVEDGAVVYNGIDPAVLTFPTREAARKQLEGHLGASLASKHVMGSIGRFAYPKNFEFVIRQMSAVLKQDPDAVYVLIGDGPDMPLYRELVQQNGLEGSVHFTGEIPNAHPLLRAFDVLVLPSVSEGMSIVLLEALCAGVAVVASDVGGNREILDDPNTLYPLDDQKAFLDRVLPLLRDETFRNDLGRRMAERASLFSIDRTVDGYLKIYESSS